MDSKNFLPGPVGRWQVGYVDIMTDGSPSESTFLRLYYPTMQKPELLQERCPIWADHDSKYGLINFVHGLVKKWPSWVNPMDIKLIDVARKADYFFSWAFSSVINFGWGVLANNPRIPVIHQAQALNQRFPLVVFSHGLGCNRCTYSKICYDLCSEGFFVAAVEHREGSAGLSRYKSSGETHEIDHLKLTGRESTDEEYSVRNTQVMSRKREISRALDLVISINTGAEIDNCLIKETGFNMASFKGLINTDQCFLMGHSFGGGTALLAASDDDRFKSVVTIDPWMFPASKINFSVNIPVLMINTELFVHKSNIKKVREVCTDLCARLLEGAVHLVHTDGPMIIGSEFVKGELGMRCSRSTEQVLWENHSILHQWLQSMIHGTEPERRYDWGVSLEE